MSATGEQQQCDEDRAPGEQQPERVTRERSVLGGVGRGGGHLESPYS
jgi:hypothetical protein